METPNNRNTAAGALIIGICVIVTAIILGGAWKKTHDTHDTISVTGLAQEDFTSDLITWSGDFSQRAMSLKEAYALLKRDADIVRSYLKGKGVKEAEIVFSAVNINKQFKTLYNDKGESVGSEFDGYLLGQTVTIESHEVDKIEKLAREVTELIDSGVELSSGSPEYFYTKLADLKIKMLANATKDARTRAENIADNAGSDIGNLRKATMGIFQITAQNSSEDYSWGGAYNTSSKRKSASITVKLEFEID